MDVLAPAHGQQHRRVAALAERLASAIGVPESLSRCVRTAAVLHHVGALGEESAGPGDDGARHLELGSRVLANSRVPAIRAAEEAARTHHERWDGTGHWGLIGEEIPLLSRIVAVAVEFEKLQKAAPPAQIAAKFACDQIAAQAGRAFDPALVAALQEVALAIRPGALGPRLPDADASAA
jgi:putative two-component system response regulator